MCFPRKPNTPRAARRASALHAIKTKDPSAGGRAGAVGPFGGVSRTRYRRVTAVPIIRSLGHEARCLTAAWLSIYPERPRPFGPSHGSSLAIRLAPFQTSTSLE